ncbi:hypothetical protein [Nitrospira sp. BLG_2]|uniref:hypothetical protein n=1 Tax=Nitrospira sp. BLG_2 TaxID=3397507 RepID=UPI003B9A8075
MTYSYLQVTTLVLTCESALFLLKGNFWLTPQAIAVLSQPFWDNNPFIVESLANQYGDTRIGAILLILAFLVQIIALGRGPMIDDIGPTPKWILMSSLIAGAAIFLVCWWTSYTISDHISSDVRKIFSDIRARESTP